MNKYKLTEAKKDGLFQIQALRDIPEVGVTAGDLGGWLEKESNLSQEGNAWVSENALVYGDARVFGYAQVYGDAQVYGNAWVSGKARVYGNAWVSGNALVYGNARVYGNAWVSGNALVSENALVYGDAQVFGYAQVSGKALVYGDAQVYGDARVYGNARVSGDEWNISPLYIQGTRHSITTCSHNEIAIGCEIHTVKEWLKNYKTIGKKNNYSSTEILEYKLVLDFAAAWLRKRPWNRK
jgi:carbonic anhydrase/acetyltransferase-like protein (isoleucine patch superfamily)